MGRGNPTTAQVRAARREAVKQAVKNLEIGGQQDYAANVLGVSRWTLYRDLEKIGAKKDAVQFTPDERLSLKRAQYDVLLKLELATTAGTIPPDVTNALVKIRSEIGKLLGINAESRSMRLNLNVDATSDDTSEFARWKRATVGLTEAQKNVELVRIEALPRDVPVIEAIQRQLGDGHAD
jgi:hypothetical protein